jgi:anti-sigma B factor antagonist
MEPEFSVTTAKVAEGAYVVAVTGEADLHTATEIERALQNVLAGDGSAVALDLAEVGFIDSTALGVLLKFQPRFKARGGELLLVSEDRRVLRTLEITGLDRIFQIHHRLATAVETLCGALLSPQAAATPEPV